MSMKTTNETSAFAVAKKRCVGEEKQSIPISYPPLPSSYRKNRVEAVISN